MRRNRTSRRLEVHLDVHGPDHPTEDRSGTLRRGDRRPGLAVVGLRTPERAYLLPEDKGTHISTSELPPRCLAFRPREIVDLEPLKLLIIQDLKVFGFLLDGPDSPLTFPPLPGGGVRPYLDGRCVWGRSDTLLSVHRAEAVGERRAGRAEGRRIRKRVKGVEERNSPRFWSGSRR